MGYEFDGENKLIILDSPDNFDIADLYSRWKEWVLDGYSQYPSAFRTLGGDPISPTQSVAAYFFLNNEDGWKIRPYEGDYELVIDGNLYPEDYTGTMFVPTVGGYSVLITIERSSAAIAYTVDSGSGLTEQQNYWLNTVYKNILLQTALELSK